MNVTDKPAHSYKGEYSIFGLHEPLYVIVIAICVCVCAVVFALICTPAFVCTTCPE